MTVGRVNYLRPGGPPNRRFVAPGAEMNTGTYEPVSVTIGDARAAGATLATHGFELLPHSSAVTDFHQASQVDALYADEIDALVRQVTGAALTIPFGWMLRSSGATGEGRQPPAADVHVDLTPARARQAGATFLLRDGHDPSRYGRFAIFSVWRAITPPPQDWPLALCAGYSVADSEGEPNLMILVDTLPDLAAAIAPLADEGGYFAADVFAHSPGHRWFTYPAMTRDEAVMITFYDSAGGANWRVPHTAFHDFGAAATVPRESIELRTIAYWLA